MKSQAVIESYFYDENSSIEQPTQKHIESVCKHLNLPFNREMAIALIYGDNHCNPERILPEWLIEIR